MSSLPANYEQVQENYSNPKNRFLWMFCHANEVNDTWGCGFSFGCGVILFGILLLIPTIADITQIAKGDWKNNEDGWVFSFFCVFRVLSDVLCLVATIFEIFANKENRYTASVVGYYGLAASFLCNTIWLLYVLIRIPVTWKTIKWNIFSFGIGEFILLIYCWMSFCLMVRTAFRNQQIANANSPY